MAYLDILRASFHAYYSVILSHWRFVAILCPSFTGRRGEVAQGHSVGRAGLSAEPPPAAPAESLCAQPQRGFSDGLCFIRK